MPFLAEKFWKPVDQSDALALAGLVLGVGSIWLSVWLARRDIKKRIHATLSRVAISLLLADVSSVLQSIRMVRECLRAKQWKVAQIYVEGSLEGLGRLTGRHDLTADEKAKLSFGSQTLRPLLDTLRGGMKDRQGIVPPTAVQGTDELAETLAALESRLRQSGSRGDDE